MNDFSVSGIINLIPSAESSYNRLIIIATPIGGGKTELLQALSERFSVPVHNLNLSLSEKLRHLSPTERKTETITILRELIQSFYSSPILLDNIELLFTNSLKQDPLKLLQLLSRDRLIIAAWNGIIKDNQLIYAEYGHPEYRSYDASDLLFISKNHN